MRDAGKLGIYSLNNVAAAGSMPTEQLVKICDAYYIERSVGVTRAYAALSANRQIDVLVRCYNITLTINAEYVILEDGNQYRINLKQKTGDDVDLTLERLENYYDVYEPETE